MSQDQEQQQSSLSSSPSPSSTELDNLIDELVKDNLLKVRELLIKVDNIAQKEGSRFTSDEIDIMIHERYLDALRNKIMSDANTTISSNNNSNTNSRSPYFQYFK